MLKRRRDYTWSLKDAGIADQWKRHVKNLPNKGGDFGLEYEEFKDFVKKPCYYCGNEGTPKRKRPNGPISISNGIDRIDARRGYYADNIVPCCKLCNIAKRGLSIEQFLAHIRRVALFQLSRNPTWLDDQSEAFALKP